ncbi:hypothetical protein FHW21_006205 [Paraburkholderia sp. WP4_3_2]|nr:hypothetical protein [Paraburkholderia sp. WP4_3_2]
MHVKKFSAARLADEGKHEDMVRTLLSASALVVSDAVRQTQLQPLSVRVGACSRVVKVVNLIYKQRNAGADQGATNRAILELNIREVLGPQIT